MTSLLRGTVAVTAVLGMAAHRPALSAQPTPDLPAAELTVQFGLLPLYGGDATVGSISTWPTSSRV